MWRRPRRSDDVRWLDAGVCHLKACFASVHGVLWHGARLVPAVSDGWDLVWWLCSGRDLERDKSIRWMPWHQEAMKDVARCEKSWGAASRL